MNKLQNLYVDRGITGEALLVPFKRCNRYAKESLQGCVSTIARVAVYLILGPLAAIGMIVKVLHVGQVKAYNERIKQKIENREVVNDFPNQPDTWYALPIRDEGRQQAWNPVFERLDQGTKDWERCCCNIMRYVGDNRVAIQVLDRKPRWQIPAGVVRPFEG